MQEPRDQVLAGFDRLWMEVLGVDAIEESDDFFDLGGHSLSAIQFSTLIREELNLTVTFSDILRNTAYTDLREVICQAALEPAWVSAGHAGARS